MARIVRWGLFIRTASRRDPQGPQRRHRGMKVRVLLNKSHFGNLRGVAVRLPAHLFRWRSVLFGLLYEVCNLPRRMAVRCRGDIRPGVCLGLPLETSASIGPLIPCMSTHARTVDMQKLFRDFPFLTAIGHRVLLSAWEMECLFGVGPQETQCCDTASSIAKQVPTC